MDLSIIEKVPKVSPQVRIIYLLLQLFAVVMILMIILYTIHKQCRMRVSMDEWKQYMYKDRLNCPRMVLVVELPSQESMRAC